jgi:putative tricarboxylic transport membrane protein
MHQFQKVSSLAWLVVSLAIIVGSSAYPVGTLSHPGPSFLPFSCGIIMAVLSAIVFFQAMGAGREKEKKREPFLTTRWPKLAAALFILFGYTFLLESFGYILMTFIFMFFVLKVVEPVKWRAALLEAVLAAGASYALFEWWLKVPLPKGTWLRFF